MSIRFINKINIACTIAEKIGCEEGELILCRDRMHAHDARCRSAEGGDQTLLVSADLRSIK